VEKFGEAGQAIDNNTTQAHCMLFIEGYKHTLTICNTAFPRQQWLRERASMLRHTWPTLPVLYRYANTPRLSVKVPAPTTRITAHFRFSQRCSY